MKFLIHRIFAAGIMILLPAVSLVLFIAILQFQVFHNTAVPVIIPLLSGILLIYTTIGFFSQQSKRKSKERELEIVLNRISDGVVSVDNDWRYTFLNDAAMATHPFSKKETLGKVIWAVHPEMKGTVFWDKYHEAMLTKKVVDIENYYAPMDIWFSVKVYPDSGGLTIFYKNITESKKAEQKLSQTLKEVTDYKFALDESSIVAITDQKGFIGHANHNFCKISKYRVDELIGQDHRIINSGYHSKEFIKNLWATIANGKIWKGELKNKAKDGTIYWVDTTIVPFVDDKGKPYQYVAIQSDITERKQAEDNLASNEMHFQALIENSAEGIALTDEFSNNIYRSPAAKKIMGDLPKENTVNFSHPDDREDIKNKRLEVLNNPGLLVAFQGRFLHASGHYVWLEGTLTNLLHVKGVNAIVTNFHDITQRKQVEEKLMSSEKRFRALIENSYDTISLLDTSFNIIYRSPSTFRITGWTNEEIENSEGTKNVHPEDIEKVKTALRELITNPGKPVSLLYRNRHKKGHYIWLDGVMTNLLDDKDVKAIVLNFRDITERVETEQRLIKSEKIYKTIASSIPGSVICLLDTEYRYLLIEGDMLEKLGYSKDKLLGKKAADVLSPEIFAGVEHQFKKAFNGETVTRESSSPGYDIISRFIPLKDDNDVVYAIMTVAIDITELKNAQRDINELNHDLEEKIIERTGQLKKSNEELEAFSYSVSHDLRAPLRAIIGFTAILEDDYASKLDDEARRITAVIRNNTIKMGSLIDDLLAFSRMGKQELMKTEINTTSMVNEIAEDLERQNKEHNTVSWNIHALPRVNADINTIRQVWINLISNAVKYTSNKNLPHIEIGSYSKNGDTVFYVKDNGVGFDEQYTHKLFKVFQRLHSADEFEGTGVGLALVEKIVSRHGGKVWAEGKEDEGACFYFSLPLVQKSNSDKTDHKQTPGFYESKLS
jgi:PAS domain S-box-containing protein